jgi:hypothetical protein
MHKLDFINYGNKMSMNSFWWRLLLASGIIDHSLLVIIGPSLDVLTWTATSGYQLYKWMRKKPKQQVVILEVYKQDNINQSKDDFVLISHSTTSSA